MRAKKTLGQHFLTSSTAIAALVDAGEVERGDTVLEIGPGHGALTRGLLAKGARVIAVEKDEALGEELASEFKKETESGDFTLILGDILEIDRLELGLLDRQFKVVANIPYYITGRFLRLLLSEGPQPSLVALLVQKEVGERIARDQKESLLSLSVKVFGDPEYIQTVKAGSFSPPPEVDSAIIKISKISRDRINNSEKRFFELLRAGFGQKRKQLQGNLRNLTGKEALDRAFHVAHIAPNARAEDVSIEQWLALVDELS